MTGKTSNSTPAKIARALDAVMAAQPSERAELFADVHLSLDQWLTMLEDQIGGPPEQADYVRRVRIYLRALKTYPASSEEWLEVFWAFHRMFDQWTIGRFRPAVPNPAPDTEIDRLRKNIRLVLKDDAI